MYGTMLIGLRRGASELLRLPDGLLMPFCSSVTGPIPSGNLFMAMLADALAPLPFVPSITVGLCGL